MVFNPERHRPPSSLSGTRSAWFDRLRQRDPATGLSRIQLAGRSVRGMEEAKRMIRSLPCPECGRSDSPLVGTRIRKVRSYLIRTIYSRTVFISCSDCGKRRRGQAVASTALYGWWELPTGFFLTLYSIITSLLDTRYREERSDELLTEFVLTNRELLKAAAGEEGLVLDIIYSHNRGIIPDS